MDRINGEQLIAAYDGLRKFSINDPYAPEQLLPVINMFEERKSAPEASIMIYGVYNAGKSTLINTLLGREAAVTDDVPTTDKVDSYAWEQYRILDTPGVDAPIAHELVTKEQMFKADAVIFVVDPIGTAEEVKTLSVLLDLIAERKQVFLVFNEKKEISEEDFVKLKDQTRKRLQDLSREKGLTNVLKDIPIVKINAKRALRGKLTNQIKLIELSGYPNLERQLKKFLQGISPNEIYDRLKNQLTLLLDNYVSSIKSKASSETIKNYDKMLSGIVKEKSTLKLQVKKDIDLARQEVYLKCKTILRNPDPHGMQKEIEKLIDSVGRDTLKVAENQLQVFASAIQLEIEGLQLSFPQVTADKLESMTLDLTALQNESEKANASHENKSTEIDWAMLQDAAGKATTLIKSEHIVGTLQLIKKGFPSLMKGVGIKTMEKWAGKIIGRAIPVIGPAFTVVSSLYELISGDPEEKKQQQALEQQQLEKERALRQLEDFANEISYGVESLLRESVFSELDTMFEAVITQVSALRQAFSEADRQNSQRLEQLLEIQRQAVTA